MTNKLVKRCSSFVDSVTNYLWSTFSFICFVYLFFITRFLSDKKNTQVKFVIIKQFKRYLKTKTPILKYKAKYLLIHVSGEKLLLYQFDMTEIKIFSPNLTYYWYKYILTQCIINVYNTNCEPFLITHKYNSFTVCLLNHPKYKFIITFLSTIINSVNCVGLKVNFNINNRFSYVIVFFLIMKPLSMVVVLIA